LGAERRATAASRTEDTAQDSAVKSSAIEFMQ
jgi:hypothetical protein